LPDQLIDYTWGRKHTFYDVFSSGVSHIDFTEPFDHGLREMLKNRLRLALFLGELGRRCSGRGFD